MSDFSSWNSNVVQIYSRLDELETPQQEPVLEKKGGGPHDPSMEARIAVLEQIARSTEATLKEIRDDLRGMRSDQKTDTGALRSEIGGLRTDIGSLRDKGISAVKWLLGLGFAGFAAVFGVLAAHFHWK